MAIETSAHRRTRSNDIDRFRAHFRFRNLFAENRPAAIEGNQLKLRFSNPRILVKSNRTASVGRKN
jgi:hypothetical protein